MRVYFQPAREYREPPGTIVELAPSSIETKTVVGGIVQTGLVYHTDSDGHWYVDTTNTFYTSNQKYILWTTTTTLLGVVTEDHPFWHDVSGVSPPAPIPPGGAKLVQAALWIQNRINEHSFSLSFTAIRAYSIVYDIRELKALTVSVIPTSRQLTRVSRSAVQVDYGIDVAVQQKSAGLAERDDLVYLVEEIMDWIEAQRRYGDFVLVTTQNEPVVLPAHLRTFGVFTSIITITLKGAE